MARIPEWVTAVALAPVSLDPKHCARSFLEALVTHGPFSWARVQAPPSLRLAASAPGGQRDPAFRLALADVGSLEVAPTRALIGHEERALRRLAARFAVGLRGAIAHESAGGDRFKALEEAERFLESILENLPDMVFVKDAAELRFVRVNRAAEELIGLRRSELLGRSDFDFFPKEQARAFIRKDREVLAGGVMRDIPEEPLQTRHRGTRYLHTKKIPIFDEAGRPRFLLGISEDITERKAAQGALDQLNEELEDRVRRRTAALEMAYGELEAFVHSVSHDLRTPLRSIQSCGELLQEDCGDQLDDNGRALLRQVLKAGDRLGALFDALLSLSGVSRRPFSPAPVALDALAERLGAELQEIYPHAVDLRVQPGMTAVGDPALMEILLGNLLGNAYKFTRDAAAPRVVVSCTDGTVPRYCVEDNGVGFSPVYASLLFRPFQRLHAKEGFEGTGIGLATAAHIVRRHGGAIRAEGVPGQGARVHFTLGATDPIDERTMPPRRLDPIG